MIADGKTLWMDQAQQRFFLIPDETPLPEGAFVIRTVLGRRRDVVEAALAPFAIARADADARMRAQVATLFGGVKDALAGAAQKGRAQGGSGLGQQALDALAKLATDLNERMNAELTAATAEPKDPPTAPAKDEDPQSH
jgi:hypothetical protein